jgi:DNA adenine methylase
VGRAARLLFLNRHCFNGIYRTNKDGDFNVPYAGSKSGTMPTERQLCTSATLLRRASLAAQDFGVTLSSCGSGDFIYLDPPYASTSARVFTEYGPHPFVPQDLDRLAQHLCGLDSRGAVFALSYELCADTEDLMQKWHWQQVSVHRNIAGFVSSRRTAVEVVITNT